MLLLLALLVAAPQDPKPREKEGTAIHGLVIPVPTTWTRKDDPSGVVYLVPPQIQTSLPYLLAVFPPNKLQGVPHWVAHKAMAKDLLDQAKWTGGEPVILHKVEGPGIFIKSEVAGKDGAG